MKGRIILTTWKGFHQDETTLNLHHSTTTITGNYAHSYWPNVILTETSQNDVNSSQDTKSNGLYLQYNVPWNHADSHWGIIIQQHYCAAKLILTIPKLKLLTKTLQNDARSYWDIMRERFFLSKYCIVHYVLETYNSHCETTLIHFKTRFWEILSSRHETTFILIKITINAHSYGDIMKARFFLLREYMQQWNVTV